MKDTGGTVQDYARLNADYSNVNEDALLKEYYKKLNHIQTQKRLILCQKKHLVLTQILMKSETSKEKLAKKEAVVEAREFLEDLKKNITTRSR